MRLLTIVNASVRRSGDARSASAADANTSDTVCALKLADTLWRAPDQKVLRSMIISGMPRPGDFDRRLRRILRTALVRLSYRRVGHIKPDRLSYDKRHGFGVELARITRGGTI